MDAKEVAKIMQLYYTLQSRNTSSGSGSALFEVILNEAVKSRQGIGITKGAGNNPAYMNNTVNSAVSKDVPKSIADAISYASKKYGVDAALIESVIKQESDFDPNARSGAGAQGLMQLMPDTADSLGVKNPFDVLENVDGGTKYLKSLLDNFNGNKELALSAYNGGIGRMERLGVDTTAEISRMPSETRNYVRNVIKNYEKHKK